MNTKHYKAVRVGSSDRTAWVGELKANHESDELKQLLERGFKVKRARIQKAKQPKEVIVSVFGGKLKMTFTEYQEKGQGLKVLMEIF